MGPDKEYGALSFLGRAGSTTPTQLCNEGFWKLTTAAAYIEAALPSS